MATLIKTQIILAFQNFIEHKLLLITFFREVRNKHLLKWVEITDTRVGGAYFIPPYKNY
jgi:hypothetical protein